MKKSLCIIFGFTAASFLSISKPVLGADSLAFQLQWEYSTNPIPALSVEYDKLNRPCFYVAIKDSGLMIFEASNPQQPNLIRIIPITDFDSLEVIDVFQQGNYLYLALGNIFMSLSEAGIGIVDISDPPNAFVTNECLWAGIKLLEWQLVPMGIQASTPLSGMPRRPVLHQNYPNPFNPTTTVKYDLREGSQVKIRIYNSIGKEVVTLVNEFQPAGSHSVVWDGLNQSGAIVGSGTYFYQLEIGGFRDMKKMIILK